MTTLALRNGQLLENPQDFVLNHLGIGVFETFLLKKLKTGDYGVLGLDLHLSRLEAGCKSFRLDLKDREDYYRGLREAIRLLPAGQKRDWRARIIAVPEAWYLEIEPYAPPPIHARMKSVSLVRPLPEHKTCSAIISVLSHQIAKDGGCDEGLLIDGDQIREGSWSNFFSFDSSGSLRTPARGVLPGVTREIIIRIGREFCDVCEEDIKMSDLEENSFCFLTRSLAGLQIVKSLDNLTFRDPNAFAATFSAISDRYYNLFNERNELLTIFQ